MIEKIQQEQTDSVKLINDLMDKVVDPEADYGVMHVLTGNIKAQ